MRPGLCLLGPPARGQGEARSGVAADFAKKKTEKDHISPVKTGKREASEDKVSPRQALEVSSGEGNGYL